MIGFLLFPFLISVSFAQQPPPGTLPTLPPMPHEQLDRLDQPSPMDREVAEQAARAAAAIQGIKMSLLDILAKDPGSLSEAETEKLLAEMEAAQPDVVEIRKLYRQIITTFGDEYILAAIMLGIGPEISLKLLRRIPRLQKTFIRDTDLTPEVSVGMAAILTNDYLRGMGVHYKAFSISGVNLRHYPNGAPTETTRGGRLRSAVAPIGMVRMLLVPRALFRDFGDITPHFPTTEGLVKYIGDLSGWYFGASLGKTLSLRIPFFSRPLITTNVPVGIMFRYVQSPLWSREARLQNRYKVVRLPDIIAVPVYRAFGTPNRQPGRQIQALNIKMFDFVEH